MPKGKGNMKYGLVPMIVLMMSLTVNVSYAADEQSSAGTQTMPESLGGQAGTAAKELKETANESLSTGAMKVVETSQKVETEVQDTFKILQQQWDVLANQLQEKARQIQKQLQQQLQDFNKSFNTPKQ